MVTALVNGRVLQADGFAKGQAVLVEGDRIAAIVRESDARGATRVDLRGGLLLPGFIDVQVNGGGGSLFNESRDVDTIRRIGAAHRNFGTTGFLPTLISDDLAVVDEAMRAVSGSTSRARSSTRPARGCTTQAGSVNWTRAAYDCSRHCVTGARS